MIYHPIEYQDIVDIPHNYLALNSQVWANDSPSYRISSNCRCTSKLSGVKFSSLPNDSAYY